MSPEGGYTQRSESYEHNPLAKRVDHRYATGIAMNREPLRILLVDDHQDFLDTLAYYLGKFPSVRVIGTAVSGEEALKRIKAKQPNLVLIDVTVPDKGGFDVTRQIKALPPPPRVIIITLLNDDESRAMAQEAGADGSLGKWEITTKLFALIREFFPDRA
jgi:DNA-binding NarL/FixJ family response regulator